MTGPLGPGDVLDRLLATTVLLGNDMSRRLAERGLGDSRAHLLFVLQSDGPSSQNRLAEVLGVAPRTITGLVDGLTRSGHVTREPNPADRRSVLVTLTDRGRETASELARERQRLAEQLFGGWDPERLDAFAASMDLVLERLETLLGR